MYFYWVYSGSCYATAMEFSKHIKKSICSCIGTYRNTSGTNYEFYRFNSCTLLFKFGFIYKLKNAFSMAERGDAPKAFLKLNSSGVPVRAVLFGTFFAYIGVVFSYISPDKVFLFLVNASGGIALLVYLVIAVSHLKMRKKWGKWNNKI